VSSDSGCRWLPLLLPLLLLLLLLGLLLLLLLLLLLRLAVCQQFRQRNDLLGKTARRSGGTQLYFTPILLYLLPDRRVRQRVHESHHRAEGANLERHRVSPHPLRAPARAAARLCCLASTAPAIPDDSTAIVARVERRSRPRRLRRAVGASLGAGR